PTTPGSSRIPSSRRTCPRSLAWATASRRAALRAPGEGSSRRRLYRIMGRPSSVLHPAEDGLEVASLRYVSEEGVVSPGTGDVEDLHDPARLPGRPANGLQEILLAHQPRAGAGQEDPAVGHRLQ